MSPEVVWFVRGFAVGAFLVAFLAAQWLKEAGPSAQEGREQ